MLIDRVHAEGPGERMHHAVEACFARLRRMIPIEAALCPLTYSPLMLFRFTEDGSFSGFWGWANRVRFLGSLIVVAGIARLACASRERRWAAGALGVTWGLFAWISQENFSTTLLASMLLIALLWLNDTCDIRRLLIIGSDVLFGFGLVWAPLLQNQLQSQRL
jgi:hypothetical protein